MPGVSRQTGNHSAPTFVAAGWVAPGELPLILLGALAGRHLGESGGIFPSAHRLGRSGEGIAWQDPGAGGGTRTHDLGIMRPSLYL